MSVAKKVLGKLSQARELGSTGAKPRNKAVQQLRLLLDEKSQAFKESAGLKKLQTKAIIPGAFKPSHTH